MEHLDFPDFETWHRRCEWFDDELEKKCLGGYDVSEQAAALSSELRAVFCCGAWYTVIILAVTIIDATLRETEMPGHKGSTADLVKQVGFSSDFDWLRKRRNKLVHIDVTNSVASMDNYESQKEELENDAKRAIGLVFDALFFSPYV